MIACCKKAEVISNPRTKEFDLSSLKGSLIFGEIISSAAILTSGPPGIDTKNCSDIKLQFGGFSVCTRSFEFPRFGYFLSLRSDRRLKMGT